MILNSDKRSTIMIEETTGQNRVEARPAGRPGTLSARRGRPQHAPGRRGRGWRAHALARSKRADISGLPVGVALTGWAGRRQRLACSGADPAPENRHSVRKNCASPTMPTHTHARTHAHTRKRTHKHNAQKRWKSERAGPVPTLYGE